MIWNVSPIATVAGDEREPAHRQLPEDRLSHREKWEKVSAWAIDVHSATGVPVAAIEPAEAVAHASDLRVVSVAALLVPSSPGSPTCSLT